MKEEFVIYDLGSLGGDVGGILGMLLGTSVLALYDVAQRGVLCLFGFVVHKKKGGQGNDKV